MVSYSSTERRARWITPRRRESHIAVTLLLTSALFVLPRKLTLAEVICLRAFQSSSTSSFWPALGCWCAGNTPAAAKGLGSIPPAGTSKTGSLPGARSANQRLRPSKSDLAHQSSSQLPHPCNKVCSGGEMGSSECSLA